jgi:hypothetical protein
MTVKHNVDAKTLGKRFAQLVRERDLPVQSVWVRDTGEVPEIWIITEPMDLASERPIHQALVDLHRIFPVSLFDDRVINPSWIPEFVAENEIPPGTVRIYHRS